MTRWIHSSGGSASSRDERLELGTDRSRPRGRGTSDGQRRRARAGAAEERCGLISAANRSGHAERAARAVGDELPVEAPRARPCSRGSTTGRSEPYRSCRAPTTTPMRRDRVRPVGGGLVEHQRVRPGPRGPPREDSRSACSGASPASIEKTTRRRGWAGAPGGVEGQPRGVQLRDVAVSAGHHSGSASEPAPRPGAASRPGPGWTNSGAPRARDGEQRSAAPSSSIAPGERAGGQRDADAAARRARGRRPAGRPDRARIAPHTPNGPPSASAPSW